MFTNFTKRFWLTFFALFFCNVAGLCHPLPSLHFDRHVEVEVVVKTNEQRTKSQQILVRYQLEVSLLSILLDSKGLFTEAEEKSLSDLQGRPIDFAKAYADKKAALIADSILANVNGQDLKWESSIQKVSTEETHIIIEFLFAATTKPMDDAKHRLEINDFTFEGKSGVVDWRFAKTDQLSEIQDASDLRNLPPLDLTREQANRRRYLAATINDVQQKVQVNEAAKITSISSTQEKNDDEKANAKKSQTSGLLAYLDTSSGVIATLCFACIFGMGHALTPGHGKTLVAAYLVGERGTYQHAVLLGLSTTLSHTGSVIIIAVVLRYLYHDAVPEKVQAWLQLLGGLLIVAVGLWLLIQRLANRADHIHLNLGGKNTGLQKPSWLRVVLLGLAGGIIPCWDAVMLLLLAISTGKLAFALPLLLAFSLGLSAMLVGLGLVVVFTMQKGGKRFGDSPWFRMLPIASAVILVALGLWFCRDGFHNLEQSSKVHANR